MSKSNKAIIIQSEGDEIQLTSWRLWIPPNSNTYWPLVTLWELLQFIIWRSQQPKTIHPYHTHKNGLQLHMLNYFTVCQNINSKKKMVAMRNKFTHHSSNYQAYKNMDNTKMDLKIQLQNTPTLYCIIKTFHFIFFWHFIQPSVTN